MFLHEYKHYLTVVTHWIGQTQSRLGAFKWKMYPTEVEYKWNNRVFFSHFEDKWAEEAHTHFESVLQSASQ